MICVFSLSCDQSSRSRSSQGRASLGQEVIIEIDCKKEANGCNQGQIVKNFWNSFDLRLFIQLYRSSSSLVDLEEKLNSTNKLFHSLDYNRDRSVDYIKVEGIKNLDDSSDIILWSYDNKKGTSEKIVEIFNKTLFPNIFDVLVKGQEKFFGINSIYKTYLLRPFQDKLMDDLLAADNINIDNISKFKPVKSLDKDKYYNKVKSNLQELEFHPVFLGIQIPVLVEALSLSSDIEVFEKKINLLDIDKKNIDLNYDSKVDFLYVSQNNLVKGASEQGSSQSVSISFYNQKKELTKLMDIIFIKLAEDKIGVEFLCKNFFWGKKSIYKRVIENKTLSEYLWKSENSYISKYNLQEKAVFYTDRSVASLNKYRKNYDIYEAKDDYYLDYGIDSRRVMLTFLESKNMSDFEKKINSNNFHIIDTNKDGNIDFLSVYEKKIGDEYQIEIKAKFTDSEKTIANISYKKYVVYLLFGLEFWPNYFFSFKRGESSNNNIDSYFSRNHQSYLSEFSNYSFPDYYSQKTQLNVYGFYIGSNYFSLEAKNKLVGFVDHSSLLGGKLEVGEYSDKEIKDFIMDKATAERFARECKKMIPICYVYDGKIYYRREVYSRNKQCLSTSSGDSIFVSCTKLNSEKFRYVWLKSFNQSKTELLSMLDRGKITKDKNFAFFLRKDLQDTCLTVRGAEEGSKISFEKCDFTSANQKFILEVNYGKSKDDSFFNIKNILKGYCLSYISSQDDAKPIVGYKKCKSKDDYEDKRERDFIEQAFIFFE
jgi:hypothetical protein